MYKAKTDHERQRPIILLFSLYKSLKTRNIKRQNTPTGETWRSIGTATANRPRKAKRLFYCVFSSFIVSFIVSFIFFFPASDTATEKRRRAGTRKPFAACDAFIVFFVFSLLCFFFLKVTARKPKRNPGSERKPPESCRTTTNGNQVIFINYPFRVFPKLPNL